MNLIKSQVHYHLCHEPFEKLNCGEPGGSRTLIDLIKSQVRYHLCHKLVVKNSGGSSGIRTHDDACACRIKSPVPSTTWQYSRLVPPVGFEPTTYGLKVRCSGH